MGVIYNRNRKNALLFIPSGGLGPSVSAAFSYDKTSYNQSEANPTPTITGTTGGTFSSDAGVSFVSTSTGEIDLSASTIASHTIFYIVDGVQASQTIDIVAAPYASTSSFTFDGINDYFDLGINTSLNIGGNLSISAWVYVDAHKNFNFIISKFTDASNRNYELYVRNTGNVTFVSNSDSTNSTTLIPINTWTHLVVTVESGVTNGTKFYFNGTLDGTTGTTTVASQTNATTIGRRSTGLYNFNGKLDEVSIWNTALSSDAVTEIASGPNDLTNLTNASSSNLKAWYKMGE
jgi:hypothetical protein